MTFKLLLLFFPLVPPVEAVVKVLLKLGSL